MKKYDIIAFDLDGTLSDPSRGLIASFVYTFKKLGINYGDAESLKRFIGPPIYEAWQDEFGFSPEESSDALRVFHEYYQVYGWWDNEMYQGIPEMLAGLKSAGKKIVLATSKPEFFAKKTLELFDIAKYFDFIGGAASDKVRDKKHEVLEYSLKSVGACDLSRAILVGDRIYDAEGAAKCKIDSMGVLYGLGSEKEVLSAPFTLIAEKVSDINKILI